MSQLVWRVALASQYPAIPLELLSVRETERKGLGLFAREVINQKSATGKEWGIEVFGELVPDAEGVQRERAHQLHGHAGYCVHRVIGELGELWHIDTFAHGSLARFINHSCEPNCQAWRVRETRHCIIFPLREIAGQSHDCGQLRYTVCRRTRGASVAAPHCLTATV